MFSAANWKAIKMESILASEVEKTAARKLYRSFLEFGGIGDMFNSNRLGKVYIARRFIDAIRAYDENVKTTDFEWLETRSGYGLFVAYDDDDVCGYECHPRLYMWYRNDACMQYFIERVTLY